MLHIYLYILKMLYIRNILLQQYITLFNCIFRRRLTHLLDTIRRLLHHRVLYRHIHKVHHEWQSPIAPTVLYCHPIEFFLSNMLPGVLGPLLTGSHTATFILWIQIQIIFSMHQHSGYHLPFMPSPEAHDYHHLKYVKLLFSSI